jgi:hypothetical protein
MKKTKNQKTKNQKKEKKYKPLDMVNDLAQALVITSFLFLLTISFILVGIEKKVYEAKSIAQTDKTEEDSSAYIAEKGENFFGKLFSDSFQVGDIETAIGLGDDIRGESTRDSMEPAVPDIGIMPIIQPIKYNYVYTGPEIPNIPENMNVYRRTKPDLRKEFVPNLNQSSLLFDARKIEDVKIDNLNIKEDKDYGYSFYLNLKDASFSINKNWEKWPQDKNYQRIEINEVLSDQEILDISERFLNYYGINLSNYKEGSVQKNWMRSYLLSENKDSFYIPETVSVTYPLTINEMVVYGGQGNEYGLTLSIDMRERKVTSLYNLYYHQFEASSYPTTGNLENILDKLNSRNSYLENEEIDIIEIEIGEPKLGLLKSWHYDENITESYNIYVPAYIFPVISESKPSYFNQENIVVPVIEDFFRANQGGGVMPMPMRDFDDEESYDAPDISI